MELDLQDKIIAVAHAEVNRRSWMWLEPVDVQLISSEADKKVWLVQTNTQGLGCNARIYIRESDLKVIKAAFLLR